MPNDCTAPVIDVPHMYSLSFRLRDPILTYFMSALFHNATVRHTLSTRGTNILPLAPPSQVNNLAPQIPAHLQPVVVFPDSSASSEPLPVVPRASRAVVPYNPVYVPPVSSLGYFESAAVKLCKLAANSLPFPPSASYQLCLLAARELAVLGQSITPKSILAKAKSLFKRNPSILSVKPVSSSSRVVSVSQGSLPVNFTSSGNFSANKQVSSMAKNSRTSRNATQVRNAPVARSVRVTSANRPKMTTSRGNIVVTHREMIGSLISSATTLAFSATSFVLNPGKASTFPWMSTLAQNYDKYILRSFEVSLVSNQPTSTAGRIGVGVDYDSTDPLPADRVEFFNLTHHTEGAPWDTLSFRFPLDNKSRFVNSHTTTDSKLIDCGQLIFISDQIVATSTSLADIIVSYSIELLEAQQAPLSTMHMWGSNITAFSALAVSGPVVGSPLATSSATVFEVSLPAGCYVAYAQTYDGGAGSPSAAVAVHGGTGFNQSASSLSTTYTSNYSHIKITTNDGTIRYTLGTVALSALEAIQFEFTRISPAVFAAFTRMQAFTNVPPAVATY